MSNQFAITLSGVSDRRGCTLVYTSKNPPIALFYTECHFLTKLKVVLFNLLTWLNPAAVSRAMTEHLYSRKKYIIIHYNLQRSHGRTRHTKRIEAEAEKALHLEQTDMDRGAGGTGGL